jgi:hypothetical protein
MIYVQRLEKGLFTLSQLCILSALIFKHGPSDVAELFQFLLQKAGVDMPFLDLSLRDYLDRADPSLVGDLNGLPEILKV